MPKTKLDQYYTKEEVAKLCIGLIPEEYKNSNYTWVEPACGTGAFFNNFPTDNKVALDIDPKLPEAISQDYYEYEHTGTDPVVVVTNPPFGSFSKDAVKFFNRSAEFADVICMLIPCSFESYRIQNQLAKGWTLRSNQRVRPNAFITDGEDYSLRCTFQVWERPKGLRLHKPIPKMTHKDFKLIGDGGSTSSIRQRGHLDFDYNVAVPWWDCKGRVYTKAEAITDLRVCTNYWLIKAKDPVDFLDKWNTLDLSSCSSFGQSNAHSLRWNDFIELYNGKTFKTL